MNPVMVEATRGCFLDLLHRGAAVVVDSLGRIIRSWGSIYDPIFPHAALNLIQALPLLESGAVEGFHLTYEEIALACSSHHGEEIHIKILEKWLQKLGKDERILACGPCSPLQAHSTKEREDLQTSSSALYNPCSGKHLGFLTTALYRNEQSEGYLLKDHPVQRRLEKILNELIRGDTDHPPQGLDICGIPTYAVPLYNLALAMARFADPLHLHYPRQQAIHQVLKAIGAHPDLISGHQGFDSTVIRMTQGQIICKANGQGVEVGIIPSLGLGVALKIDDGNVKASEIAFLAILRSLGCIDGELYEKLGPRLPIFSYSGKTIGFLQPTHFTTLPSIIRHH